MTRKLLRVVGLLACLLGSMSMHAQTYTNEAASVIWPFNSDKEYATDVTGSPDGVFSVMNFILGDNSVIGTAHTTVCPDVNFVRVRAKNGGTDLVIWSIKPSKGLTFTPTKISFYISRNGTDGDENAVHVQGRVVGGSLEKFSDITPHRNNKTQADDKLGKSASYTTLYEYTLTADQQKALTSGDGFELVLNNGYANNKDCMYSDVQIHGLINGTKIAVEKFAVTAKANIEAGGKVSILPASDLYEQDAEITLKAERNFGYSFVNWTDAAGKQVSTEPEFKHTVTAAEVFTANFKEIPTYELKYAVEGGANLYQVQPSPAGTMVDGKRMYEQGTSVTLTATGNKIVKFTNWNDGQSSSEIIVKMDDDHTDIVASFDTVDFIAGWDFITSGNSGRVADFAAADNDAAAIVLRDEAGTSKSWLDKSQFNADGYEGRPAAVNWNTDGLGKYYWQTTVNASAFTDLKVMTAMTYNYNSYTVYDAEYSLDGENWTKIGSITLDGAKNWIDAEFSLPAAANNQPSVSIRFKPDKTSKTDGTTSSNDGNALGATFIVGTAKLINDGKAPELVAQVPENDSEGASINGKIVLTFDEKVKVKEGTVGKLGSLSLTPSVTGKTVMFEYKNLSYSTPYTFTLPAGVIMDLTDNAVNKEITIKFTTRTRPVVKKALFDAEVSTVDELVAALGAAEAREDNSKRFRIFIHNGLYRLPASATATKDGSDGKAYPDPTTYINTPNVSLIGESRDGVVITNTVPASGSGANVLEGIGKGDVIDLNANAKETYFQDLTMKSAMGDSKGRDIVLRDNSDKTIAKNICLWGYQDTYVSNNENSRFYFEGGLLRGRTDFLCGKGDVYYNAVTLQMCEDGGYIAVPSKPKQYGYVFRDCEIVGENSGLDGKYTLGRPWGSGTPIALFINTTMHIKPSADGWNEMSGGYPARFAEYNSVTSTGTVIDLKNRKKNFGDQTNCNNPVLTKDEADFHSYERVVGGSDDWDPASKAEQAPEPANVYIYEGVITWSNNDYALLWAVCRDGKVVAFTTEPTYTVDAARAADEAVWSVRAANEMGGLGEAVEAIKGQSSIVEISADEVVSTVYYNLQGQQVNANTPGVLVRVDTLSTGATRTSKVIVK